MMMDGNPYQATPTGTTESPSVVPHTASVREEAWRGFIFGAKVTGMVMSVICLLVFLLVFGRMIYVIALTGGEALNEVSYWKIARGIGGSIVGILLMSFYGGIAGGLIMMLAALIRKRRFRESI